jgi:hypothetical protein
MCSSQAWEEIDSRYWVWRNILEKKMNKEESRVTDRSQTQPQYRTARMSLKLLELCRRCPSLTTTSPTEDKLLSKRETWRHPQHTDAPIAARNNPGKEFTVDFKKKDQQQRGGGDHEAGGFLTLPLLTSRLGYLSGDHAEVGSAVQQADHGERRCITGEKTAENQKQHHRGDGDGTTYADEAAVDDEGVVSNLRGAHNRSCCTADTFDTDLDGFFPPRSSSSDSSDSDGKRVSASSSNNSDEGSSGSSSLSVSSSPSETSLRRRRKQRRASLKSRSGSSPSQSDAGAEAHVKNMSLANSDYLDGEAGSAHRHSGDDEDNGESRVATNESRRRRNSSASHTAKSGRRSGSKSDDSDDADMGSPGAATSYLFTNPLAVRVSDILADAARRQGEAPAAVAAVAAKVVSVSCLSISPNKSGNAFVIGTTTGDVIWFADLAAMMSPVSVTEAAASVGKRISVLHAHRDAVTDLVWAPPNGDVLLSLSLDAMIIAWDMRRMNKIRQIPTTYQPLVAAFLPRNSNFVLVGLRKQPKIRVYNLSTGICVLKVACGSTVGAMAAVDDWTVQRLGLMGTAASGDDSTAGGRSITPFSADGALVLTGDARGELNAYSCSSSLMSPSSFVKLATIAVEPGYPVVSVACQSVSSAQRAALLAAPQAVPSSRSLCVLVSSRCDVISLYLFEDSAHHHHPSTPQTSFAGTSSTTPTNRLAAHIGASVPVVFAQAAAALTLSATNNNNASSPSSSTSSGMLVGHHQFVLARRISSFFRIRHFNTKSIFCEDSRRTVVFASGSEDGTVRIASCGADSSGVQSVAVLRTASGGVCTALAWTPGSTHLLGGAADGLLAVWPRVKVVLSENWEEVSNHQNKLRRQQEEALSSPTQHSSSV